MSIHLHAASFDTAHSRSPQCAHFTAFTRSAVRVAAASQLHLFYSTIASSSPVQRVHSSPSSHAVCARSTKTSSKTAQTPSQIPAQTPAHTHRQPLITCLKPIHITFLVAFPQLQLTSLILPLHYQPQRLSKHQISFESVPGSS